MKLPGSISTAVLLGSAQLHSAAGQASEQPILALSEDENFNFDILTGMAQVVNDGGDISPLLEAAKNIVPNDWESYSQVFFDLANNTKALGLDPAIAYDAINVRATWFSVANYFRRADVYNRADWDDPRINDYWDEQREAFDKAIAALPVPAERVRIAADNFTIEAIWYAPLSSRDGLQRLPTLALGQGFDAAQEDLYSTIVAPALARGYNVLTFEGPGQPTVLREQGIGFIPDWERVVTPVADYLLSEKNATVDPQRLVLYGHSLGGYLEARAAAFEPRFTALMLNGGVWDMYDGYSQHLPADLLQLYESGQQDAFDQAVEALLNDPEVPTTPRWGLLQGLWSFNIKSPYEFFDAMKQYTLKGGIAEMIQVPTWIADGEYETLLPGQSQLVKDALGDRAELHTFMGAAGFHCQTGAPQELNRVMFAWLHKTLNTP